jgi:hypothetical protein
MDERSREENAAKHDVGATFMILWSRQALQQARDLHLGLYGIRLAA